MIKNVVFDFGGVIVDLDREQAVKAFVHLGLTDAGHILDKYHQTGIFQELEEGKLREEDYREKLGQLCGRTLKRRSTSGLDEFREWHGLAQTGLHHRIAQAGVSYLPT